MRAFFLLLPLALMAQTAPPKAQPAAPKAPAKTATTPPATTKTGTPGPKKAAPAATAMTTDDEKTVYALGLMMARALSQYDLTPAELELVKKAVSDAAAGKPALPSPETWGPKIDALGKARNAKSSAAYLAKCAAEPGAQKTASGLVYRDLKVGTGASPKATDNVKVHYRGTLTNGTEFDSSYKRNAPASLGLNQVIACWTEGVQKMKVGGKAQLVCPSSIAYGDRGQPPIIPGGATLVFEIELLDITK